MIFTKTLDVLWKGLKIIDEDYLKEVEMKKAEEKIKLKNAHDIVITYGNQMEGLNIFLLNMIKVLHL
ncbi:MAG: hypothetical protein V8S33_01290 [Intestinibacter bartlettii]